MELHEKLNPRKHDFNGKMTSIVGAIMGHDYGDFDPSIGPIKELKVTSNGQVLANGVAYVGTFEEMYYNLDALLSKAGLTSLERAKFDSLYRQNVQDWRA